MKKTMSECPPTPRSENIEDLGFVRKAMVGWFDPGQLINTAVRAMLSIIFSGYADKREMQAALRKPLDYDYAGEKEIWFDFIADLGDGWNSTYTMAKLLAQEKLAVKLKAANSSIQTNRGQFLIMGGDEVYPTASREEYENRLTGPYQSALPYVANDKAPHLFAIPGNHDWYDGLTSFIRLFCHERWIGGWKTKQSRSYFAIKMPHNWWLWGIDIQLEADIDKPQLDYFECIAKQQMQKGDRIILCTAEPSWIKGPDAYQNLAYFEKNVIRKYGGDLVVTLSGDLHHYSRFQEEKGSRQKITAGGGGAYLSATHQLPENIALQEGSKKVTYSRAATFPSTKTSRKLTWGGLFFPFRNWGFSLFLGAVYLLFVWVLQSASMKAEMSIMASLKNIPFNLSGIGTVLKEFYFALAHSPCSVIILLAITVGLIGFSAVTNRSLKLLSGGAHGIIHLLLIVSLTWLFSRVNLFILDLEIDRPIQALLFSVEMLTLGSILGGFIMAMYLILSDLILKSHTNELFSAQAIVDYKNFLRLHIDSKGKLTIYPVGVRNICKKWRLNTKAQNGESWFEPQEGHSISPHLIEPPIKI